MRATLLPSVARSARAEHSSPLNEASPDLQRQARRGSRAGGAAFFAAFGGLWLLVGYHLGHWHSGVPIILLGAGTGLLVLASIRTLRTCRSAMAALRKTSAYVRTRRQFRTINFAQAVAIFTAVYFLDRFHRGTWVVPAVLLIVGLHMLPLARTFRYRAHFLTGAALVVTALLYPWVTPSGPESPWGAIVAGAILWLSALWSLRAQAH